MTDMDEIRNLLAAYCHLLDDGDKAFVNLFIPSGAIVEEGREMPIGLLPAITKQLAVLREKQSDVLGRKHLSMNHVIRINGNTATAVSDLLITTLISTGAWVTTGNGRYTDKLVKDKGAWKFERRTVTWYLNRPYRVGDPQTGPLFSEMLDKALAAIKSEG